MLDLRQLRYFVAVAESENVGRAAEQLHISQSPLSRQIMQLEAQLGLRLFERARQRVRLTAEGHEFLREAHELLVQAERLETRGRRLGDGSAGSLTIGYVEGAVHAGLIATTLRSFRRDRPGLELHLLSQRSHAQFEGLRQRTLDIGFTYAAPPDGDPDLASTLLRREKLLLALPPCSPLAELERVTPADLDGTIWITVVRQPRDTNRDAFLAACARAGFLPKIAYETADPLTSLGLVGAGLGLAVVQQSLRAIAPPEMLFRELPWFDRSVSLHLVWRTDDARPVIIALRAAAEAQSPR
jgi:DNA-binding transcriptional LysR family regulator